MYKFLLMVTLIASLYLHASSQNFLYPKISNHAKSIKDFIPNNWIILDSTQGDLNKDNYADVALVIQFTDSIISVEKSEEEIDTTVMLPRILIILFYNPIKNEYQLVEQTNTFIICSNIPGMDEPFEDISIVNNILKIDFQLFMSRGGWGMSNNYYKFRYQQKEFKLIGANYVYVNRGSGETEERSYNFLTKRVKISTGTISNDSRKVSWIKLNQHKLKTFKTYEKPFEWEVEKNFFL